MAILGDPGADSGAETKTKIKTGGKKFDEQKYERKIRAPGDKLFTHQFQTAERILAPDWAEKFATVSQRMDCGSFENPVERQGRAWL